MFLEINHTITSFLNNFVLQNNLKNLVWFFADSPIFFLPIFFIFFWILFEFFDKKNSENKKINKNNLLLIFYSIILWIIINLIIQHFLFFDRPETLITPILHHIPDASFPSDHATASFAFLFWLYFWWFKKIFYWFLWFVILMNTARIAWWLHWFFDIFAGSIVWFLSAFLVFKNQKNKYLIKLNNFILNFAKIFRL